MHEVKGAIDLDACYKKSAYGHCRCKPVCAICGHHPHTAIHGPLLRQPPGTKPWGHEYTPTVDGLAAREAMLGKGE